MASKHVSIDEYLGSRGYGGVERKHFARDSGVIIKAARVAEKAPKFDKDAGTIRFVMSAEIEDRDRDIVVQAGLDTTEFQRNPVAPWSHKAGEPPVGTWSDLVKTLTGRPKRTEGTLTLVQGDPMADRLAIHFEAGSVRACSIGFMPTSIERREVPESEQGGYFYPGYMIHAADLYECSPCCVPANPAALAKAAAAGDVAARETIEEVLDTWRLENGVIVPRKAFEDAHRGAGAGKTFVVVKGERYRVTDGGEPGQPPLLEKAPSIAKGDFVSWSASGGTARGKVTKVVADGTVEVAGASVTGTSEDPAAKITVWQQSDGTWAATDAKVAHKVSTLTKIAALKAVDGEPADLAEGIVSRLLNALGLKGKTEAADPAPQQGGTKPAPEPAPEEKARAERDRAARLATASQRQQAIESRLDASASA